MFFKDIIFKEQVEDHSKIHPLLQGCLFGIDTFVNFLWNKRIRITCVQRSVQEEKELISAQQEKNLYNAFHVKTNWKHCIVPVEAVDFRAKDFTPDQWAEILNYHKFHWEAFTKLILHEGTALHFHLEVRDIYGDYEKRKGLLEHA